MSIIHSAVRHLRRKQQGRPTRSLADLAVVSAGRFGPNGKARAGALLVAAGLAYCAAMPASAPAQGLPPSMQFVVGVSAGGPVDLAARLLATKIAAQFGTSVVVENRAGANGAIAAIGVKDSPPDGKMLLYAGSGMLTISPHLVKALPYDPQLDFVPVSTVAYSHSVLVVNPQIPASNLEDFIKYAATRQPSLAFGSAGNGNITHMLIEQFKDAAKVDLLHVPYKGASDALTAVMSGQIAGTFVGLALALPHIKAGKVKALSVIGLKRSHNLPAVPTFQEQGYAGFEYPSWTGILAPKNTRPETVRAIAGAVAKVLSQDDVKTQLLASDLTPWVLSGDQFSDWITKESKSWQTFIADRKITLD